MVERLISDCLRRITHPRFYDTERGFQGAFLGYLQTRLTEYGFSAAAVAEQEYQKRVREHGLAIRPDIVIHIPAGNGHDRRSGNFVVVELKRASSTDDAVADFKKLDAMILALDYAEAVFINVASDQTYAAVYSGLHAERMHFFATLMNGTRPQLRYARALQGTIREKLL